VFLEAGGMFLAPFVVNKIGAKNGLTSEILRDLESKGRRFGKS